MEYPTHPGMEAAVAAEPEDNAHRLVYADWLEDNGDSVRAKYIRARCALDECAPGDDYVWQWEQRLECEEAMALRPPPKLPTPFELIVSASYPSEWWSAARDGMLRGFPSLAELDSSTTVSEKKAKAGLRRLIDTTPIRTVNAYPALLTGPEANGLTGLHASVWREAITSPLAPSLTKLQVGAHQADVDPDAIRKAEFDRLRHLEVHHVGEATEGRAMTSSLWFPRLHRLLVGSIYDREGETEIHLPDMPDLHTLCLWGIGRRDLLGGREFPALRRLFIHASNLEGESGKALTRARLPKLMELWLRNTQLKQKDCIALTESTVFADLRALTFDGTALNAAGLKAIAISPCGARLELLRVRWGSIRSLSKTPLARPGAFPQLTTLELRHPFPNPTKKQDTAAFLANLATPKLRHLTLDRCDFDDECAEALAANPALSGLTRLKIASGTMGPNAPSRLLGSANLRHLLVLEVGDCPVGEGADLLANPDVLPELVYCHLSQCRLPERIAKRVKRRGVRIYEL